MPTMSTDTLTDLFHYGDFSVTEANGQVYLDMTVRRSGCTLYGKGELLADAVEDLWRELEDHLNAIDHLEQLGLATDELWKLTDDGQFRRREDSDIYSLPPIETYPPLDRPVTAAAGAPINSASPGYVLALLLPVQIAHD